MSDVSLRIGDEERREVDRRLTAAVGDGVLTLAEYDERAARLWQARTRGELDALTADLPPARPGVGAPAVRDGALAHGRRAHGQRVHGRLLARVSGLGLPALAGLGLLALVASGTDGRSVFGSDEVVVTGRDDSVAVSVLFGSVQVVVEQGAYVDETGLVAFGSVDCEQACVPAAGAVEVSLRALGAFGSVEVLTRAEYDALPGAGAGTDLRGRD